MGERAFTLQGVTLNSLSVERHGHVKCQQSRGALGGLRMQKFVVNCKETPKTLLWQ